MVWIMHLPLGMAIFGIYVKFPGCIFSYFDKVELIVWAGTCTYFETTIWFPPTVSARLHVLVLVRTLKPPFDSHQLFLPVCIASSWLFSPDIWTINSINSTFSQNVRIQITQFSVLSLGIPYSKWRNVSLQSVRPTGHNPSRCGRWPHAWKLHAFTLGDGALDRPNDSIGAGKRWPEAGSLLKCT